MAHALVTPFSFRDLDAEPLSPAAPAAPERDAAIDDAFERGIAMGRQATESEAVDRLADDAARLVDAVLATRHAAIAAQEMELAQVRNAASRLVKAFAHRLHADMEAQSALSMLDRLLEASSDRSPVCLSLAAATFDASRPAIAKALEARDADTFVSISADPALGPGEARLSWRGGECALLNARIDDIIDQLFAPAPERAMETPR